jgi:hypothetical protein
MIPIIISVIPPIIMIINRTPRSPIRRIITPIPRRMPRNK